MFFRNFGIIAPIYTASHNSCKILITEGVETSNLEIRYPSKKDELTVEISKFAIRYPFKNDKVKVGTSNLAIKYSFNKVQVDSGTVKARNRVLV